MLFDMTFNPEVVTDYICTLLFGVKHFLLSWISLFFFVMIVIVTKKNKLIHNVVTVAQIHPI